MFLSYSRRDLALADELIISLETHGFEMVVDREDLFPGEQWEPRLRHFITEADTTICLVSQQWIASPQCLKELKIAVENGRRIIPLIAEQIEPSALPEDIARLQFVFFVGNGRSFARGVADLVKALRTDIDWVREQTRLLDRAHEWDSAGRAEALLLRGAALERAQRWLEAPRPDQTRVLPLVADFVTASLSGQADDERKRLRGRVRTVALSGMAAIGLLTSATLYLKGQADRQTALAERAGERAETLETTLNYVADSQAAIAEQEPAAADAADPGEPSAASEAAAASPPAPVETPRTSGTGVVARLNAPDSRTRMQAGQEVVEAIRGGRSTEVIGLLVGELEGPRLEALSASGRFNILYLLNVYDDWPSSPYADRLNLALQGIEAREGAGVQIGGQTRDCMDRLRRKLTGERNVGDRCGGR